MSYPIQKIVADTIAYLIPGQFSCRELRYNTCYTIDKMYGDIPAPLSIMDKIETRIAEEYEAFSKANPHDGGFNGMHKTTADHYSQKLFNYRLEMLYYFWMANQEM